MPAWPFSRCSRYLFVVIDFVVIDCLKDYRSGRNTGSLSPPCARSIFDLFGESVACRWNCPSVVASFGSLRNFVAADGCIALRRASSHEATNGLELACVLHSARLDGTTTSVITQKQSEPRKHFMIRPVNRDACHQAIRDIYTKSIYIRSVRAHFANQKFHHRFSLLPAAPYRSTVPNARACNLRLQSPQ